MKNKFHAKTLQEELKKLRKEEKEALQKVQGKTFVQRLKSKTKIKMKYYRMRSDLFNNNYSRNQVQAK